VTLTDDPAIQVYARGDRYCAIICPSSLIDANHRRRAVRLALLSPLNSPRSNCRGIPSSGQSLTIRRFEETNRIELAGNYQSFPGNADWKITDRSPGNGKLGLAREIPQLRRISLPELITIIIFPVFAGKFQRYCNNCATLALRTSLNRRIVLKSILHASNPNGRADSSPELNRK